MRLPDEEIARLAKFMGLSETEFIAQFARLTYYHHGLALVEKPNGECIFLRGNDCAVQPVKPQQCRNFPNLWRFPGFEFACSAIPRQVSPEQWEQLVEATTGQKPPPLEPAIPSKTLKILPTFD